MQVFYEREKTKHIGKVIQYNQENSIYNQENNIYNQENNILH